MTFSNFRVCFFFPSFSYIVFSCGDSVFVCINGFNSVTAHFSMWLFKCDTVYSGFYRWIPERVRVSLRARNVPLLWSHIYCGDSSAAYANKMTEIKLSSEYQIITTSVFKERGTEVINALWHHSSIKHVPGTWFDSQTHWQAVKML